MQNLDALGEAVLDLTALQPHLFMCAKRDVEVGSFLVRGDEYL